MCDYKFKGEIPDEPPADANTFVRDLAAVTNMVRLFTAQNRRVAEILSRMESMLEELLEAGAESFDLGVSESYVFAGGVQLRDASQNAKRILATLANLGSGGISFGRGTNQEDLRAIIDLLAQEGRDIDDFYQANQALRQAGTERIRFLPPYREGGGDGLGDENADLLGDATGESEAELERSLEIPLRLIQHMSDHLVDLTDRARRGMPFSTQEARTYCENALKQLEKNAFGLLSVGRYSYWEDDLHVAHSLGVCFYAIEIARSLTSDEDLVNRIGTAAYLHDIGKYVVPDDVLFKQGRLSGEEFAIMEMHAEYGAKILLQRTSDADPISVVTAYSHHRNKYPSGVLYDGTPSTVTQIVKLCDVFEALTAKRPYKAPMPPTKAYQIMMKMAEEGQVDAGALRYFIKTIGIYPVGRHVRLRGGDVAQVVEQTKDLKRPIVSGLARHPHASAGLEDGLMNLSKLPTQEELDIVEILPVEQRAA